MNGIELIKKTFAGEQTERPPWVPFVGCHGGHIINVKPDAYLQSVEHMVNGASKAVELYKPDGLPIMFDLQVEAEALGCNLLWSDENPPAVVSHPLADGAAISELTLPQKTDGRIPLALETTKILREKYPNLGLYGLITGPFTLAMHLAGTDLFMKMFEGDDYVHELMNFCKDVCISMAQNYIDAGADIIAIVDPMTSQIGPDQFREFVTKPATEIFQHIRKQDKLSSFFVCGHAQQNIEAMCECKPDNVSVDENIPLDYVKEICLKNNISFGGNLQLTVVLLLGKPADAQRNALDCLKIGGNTGFVLSPGCDLPYATPVENLKTVTELVHDPYQKQIATTLDQTESDMDIFDMSQYGNTDKIIIDIITLDSEGCAPCQYMVEAVKKIAPQFEQIIEWREHKIKQELGIQFMTSLMVKNIPTICIDGQITFVSRIPHETELIAAIQKRILEKLKLKIRTKSGAVYILGQTDEEVASLQPSVERAIYELGIGAPIIPVTDEDEILSFGVINTPAVVVAHYKVKSEGTKPDVAIIKEWLKEL